MQSWMNAMMLLVMPAMPAMPAMQIVGRRSGTTAVR